MIAASVHADVTGRHRAAEPDACPVAFPGVVRTRGLSLEALRSRHMLTAVGA